MQMIDQQRNRAIPLRRLILLRILFLLMLLLKLQIELYQEQGLITDSGEQVVLPDEIKYVRTATAEEEGQREGWLTIQDVPSTPTQIHAKHE